MDKSTIDSSISLRPLEQVLSNLSYFSQTSKEKLVSRARFSDVIITNKVELDRATLLALPKLKLICITATGTNNVDLQAAKELGISVYNVNHYSTRSVSQYVFAMLLEIMQKTSRYIQDSRDGLWQNSPIFCHFSDPIEEIAEKKLAIIGYGTLGKAVTKIAQAFGMQVLIAERQGSTTIRESRVSFEQAISQADVISVHCPLTAENHHMFNQHTFSMMKRGAVFINTARGGLVNSEDLYIALKSKHLKAAALDVLETEPPELDNILLNAKLKNLYVTAHIAWASQQSQQRLIQAVAENIVGFNNQSLINKVV
ncbi:D-2-hydroxyacid dehydrogenase [Thalassotalea aquiviva]|uniref:D-2-hydroxyacid dehydrogenase n=1 Tax=Thalassotalea aquiviva TaxID=3242415 RepID=UPI00352AB962